ncbi:ATP-dependent DNA/RNA helicase DHX36 isoform X2 [Drosophila mojavensis]|uniref:RNA helicase n=3 Tax=Drosophila mojavensis TaxID=7230 RepID=B4KJ06_DROMO|nr:ATP-dependent DNA/RNA helicase DHX36 isoform X2 [Drosophila mojavensis]EDW13519.1 uncharacterized protein Dmoj_GI19576, isoform A [Drosophila mojavensis]
MHRGNKSQGRSGKNCSRPPGLKGRDIGMYYRNLSRQRKNSDTKYELKINLSCDVSVPPGVIERINEYMDQFKVAREAGNKHLDEDFQQKFHHMLSMNFDGFIEETKKQNQDLNLQNRSLDAHLLDKQNELFQNVDFRARYEDRMKLPTMGHAAEIIDAVDKNQVLLIVGSTGCGKTTQVPQLLLDDCIAKGIGSTCRIVCTQPRRISAITVAERVSYERVEPIGHSVGYQIRLESRKPRERASITYCTTGVLLQQLQSDPLLRSVSVLLLDEIHERSIETDLLMALLKIILPHRPTLKVILMSATVREEDFCNYFNRCPMFRIEGVMHPVEVFYLEDVLAMTGYQFDCRSNKRSRPWLDQSDHRIMIEPYIRQVRDRYDTKVLEQLRVPHSEGCEDIEFIASLIYYICNNKSDGAILVFVPGFSKISQLHNTLKNPRSPLGQRWRNHLLIFPLHSMLPSVEQQSVFRPAPKGKRKVIISTIIAETSVTIDDVVYVINTGRTKVTDYDIETNIQSLEECWVTHANTQQRKGRAGRVQPGVCYNLFSRAREALMSEVPTPEILRCKLEAIILSLKVLHIDDPYALFQTMIDPPVQRTVSTAINLLKRIEALDIDGKLTPLGMHLAKLPIDPQVGKMILISALFRCVDPITSVAAALSYKNPFYTPLGQEQRVDQAKRRMAQGMHSDHLMIHNTICNYRESVENHRDRDFCYNNFLSHMTLQQLERMKSQFSELLSNYKFLNSTNCLDHSSNINSGKIPLLRAIIGGGLYPNMAHLRKARQIKNRVRAIHNMTTDDGRRVNFHPSSVNSGETGFDSNYFVYYQRQKSTDLYLLDATMVFPMALIIFGDGVETGVVDNRHYLSVAQTYYFKCSPETVSVVLNLRSSLQLLLLEKALHPAPIEQNSDADKLIKSIELLLSIDDKMGDDYEIMSDEIDNI